MTSPGSSSGSPTSAGDRRWLWALLAGALLLRLAIIWMPGDQMFENGARPYEELLRGNATVDLMRGGLLPVLDYQVNHFSGGSLVISLLAIPVLFVCGPIFPALRLVSLVFSIPLVLITFLLIERRYGRRPAFVAASLLAFGPPGFAMLSCTVYGTHPESNMLAVALVYLYFAWRDGTRSPWRTACLGLVVGFSLWFSYGLCIVLALLLLLEFAASGLRSVLRALPAFVPGFLVGFSPWIVYMLTHPGRAFVIYESSITDHLGDSPSHPGALAKLGWLFVKDGPDGLWMHGAFPTVGLSIARVLVALYVAAVVYAGWNTRHEVAAFGRALIGRREGFRPSVRLVALGFVSAWLTAYTITDFEVDWFTWVQGYRYLMPFWPFTAILVGFAVADLSQVVRRSWVPVGAVALVCAVHLAGTVMQIRPDRLREHATASATSPRWHLRMMVLRFGTQPEMMKFVLARTLVVRTPEEQKSISTGLAQGIARLATIPATDAGEERRRAAYEASITTLIQEAPEPFRPVFEKALADARSGTLPR